MAEKNPDGKKCLLNYSDFCDENGSFDCGNHTSKCKLCNQAFQTAGILEIHLQKIHDEKPFVSCDQCEFMYIFKYRSSLNWHFRKVHMPFISINENALGCDICDAFDVINGFSTVTDLRKHTDNIHGQVTF